ncbi:MAG: bifunctional UDP-sugar hydrolase/5'-nucleotidase [Rikenellaceae bacterium]
MKTKLPILLIICSIALLSTALLYRGRHSEKSFMILSTNDMHAQIDKFPYLAAAVEACRDTIDVILVDAGDRWTGNAFVDLVEHYTPMYELMNDLDYDVTIYGNHEFDKGQAYVAVANRQANFPIIGANIVSDTTSFPQPAPHYIVDVDGKKIAFVGVVGNYDGDNHPSGKGESYEGLTFLDPHTSASEHAYLAEQCDMLVLVSHSGLDRDIEFAESPLSQGYHHIISAHSHDVANQVVNGKLISQSGSRLANIGATRVTITADGQVQLSHKNVPLSTYEPAKSVAKKVEGYYNSPELNTSIGTAAADFNHTGLKNLFAESIRARTNSQIGLYHSGGVRLSSLSAGDISVADLLNVEPFGSYIATATMTVEQLRNLVMTKFNDKVNISEARYLDLAMTTPYTIVTDGSGDAVDVIFPELDAKKSYQIAMGDYIFKTYKGLEYTNGQITEILITKTLENYIKDNGPLEPSNIELQSIE